jgi:hypothetical protein
MYDAACGFFTPTNTVEVIMPEDGLIWCFITLYTDTVEEIAPCLPSLHRRQSTAVLPDAAPQSPIDSMIPIVRGVAVHAYNSSGG